MPGDKWPERTPDIGKGGWRAKKIATDLHFPLA